MSRPAPLHEQQRAFAAFIRDPDANPPPDDVEARRMAVYRRLFFNSTRKFLDKCFRVIRRILPAERWESLTQDFFASHRCRSPIFSEIPLEFVDYLNKEYSPAPGDPPFLAELAHYEWMELALTLAADPEPDSGLRPEDDLLEGIPVLSPVAWPRRYHWPVHRIGPAYQPVEPPAAPTFLMIWRDAGDQVGVMELTVVTARLAELMISNREQTGGVLLQTLCREVGHADQEAFLRYGRQILEKFRARDILLGARPVNQ